MAALIATPLLAAALLSGARWARGDAGSPAGAGPGSGLPLAESRVRDLDIAFYQARVARDPLGAADRARLAALYLRRARETGSNEDLLRAEAAARASLRNRAARNSAALSVLANSLLAQHRYAEALEAARALAAREPDAAAARALLGEIEMELGDYEAARAAFRSLAARERDLAVAPRLARWAELVGRPEEAHRLLVAARNRALGAPGLPSEQRAWFHLRVGDLALRYGRLGEARRELEAALAAAPHDYRVLGALARLEAVRHRWRRAVEYGERAIATALDPATLGLVGDAYAALGDTAKAEDYYRALEVSIAGQPGPYHRAWSLFLLDHGRRIPEVLARVAAELETRRDIYGYDLLAWALHRSGRHAEADAAMRRALALGTRDPMLWYHAGSIAAALGRREDARRYLRAALALNPRWHWSDPERARALLAAL